MVVMPRPKLSLHGSRSRHAPDTTKKRRSTTGVELGHARDLSVIKAPNRALLLWALCFAAAGATTARGELLENSHTSSSQVASRGANNWDHQQGHTPDASVVPRSSPSAPLAPAATEPTVEPPPLLTRADNDLSPVAMPAAPRTKRVARGTLVVAVEEATVSGRGGDASTSGGGRATPARVGANGESARRTLWERISKSRWSTEDDTLHCDKQESGTEGGVPDSGAGVAATPSINRQAGVSPAPEVKAGLLVPEADTATELAVSDDAPIAATPSAGDGFRPTTYSQPEASRLATPLAQQEPAAPVAARQGGAAAALQARARRLNGRALGTEENTARMSGMVGERDVNVGNGTTVAVAVTLQRLLAAAVPEVLRTAKLLAATGIMYGAMRWLTATVCTMRANAKRQRRQERRTMANAGAGRARESVLLQAAGTRVPVDVVPSLDEAELEVAADLVDCDRLDVTFEDIAGMEGVKRSLQEIISEPLDFPPDLYPARLIKPCTGILIYGPPGCGKTLLAQAVAKQSGAAFISVKASTLMRRSGVAGGMGGSDAAHGRAGYSNVMVRAVFSLAQKIQPCIIFLDEADGLCFKREEGDAGTDRALMTELMQLWDELSCSGQDRVVVLAATNRPWDLDPAVQRRFSRLFQVGLPDRKMRKAVLMKTLEDVEVEEGFDWRELAVNTEGYSCGDVVELCREAVRGPLREAMDRNRRRAARRRDRGYRQSALHLQELQQQQEQKKQKRRRRGGWQVL